MLTIAIPTVRPSQVTSEPVTPQDLLSMENEGVFELADGKLIEKKIDLLENATAAELLYLIKNHLKSTNAAGLVVSEQSFQCFSH